MEIVKTIKTEEKSLRDLGIKLIDLKVENGEDEFIFLSENMTDLLNQELDKHKIKVISDLKVYYSLSNCQGDGFSFTGYFKYKNIYICIKQGNLSNLYNHSYTTDILFYKDENFLDEIDNKKTKEFISLYHNICKSLESQGYNIIEDTQKENILRQGFKDFLIKNSINGEYELYDFAYADKKKKGFIKICDSGDTYLSGLWIKPFKLKIEDKIQASSNITEYQDISII